MRRAIAVLLGSVAVFGQGRETNPYKLSDSDALGKGKQLYSYYCVFCHGMDGVSGRGAQLASAYRKHGGSDREMYRTIADGVPGTEMSGHFLEEDEIWKILLFVRQLEQQVANAPRGCGPAGGDAVRGAAAFKKGGCAGCHNKASRLGPELGGTSLSRDHVRESVLNPNKDISRRYRTVTVKTRSGESVRGLLLNQDEYTVHLIDTGERVQSFTRAGLAEVAFPPVSLMPSYQGRLSESEIDDIAAHLCAGGAQ
jgi:putative heme-binding domain-containing protein